MYSGGSILTTGPSDVIHYSLRFTRTSSTKAITLWNFNINTCLITTKHVSRTHTTPRRTHTVLRVSRVTEPGKLTGLLTQVGRRHSCHRQRRWQDAKTRRPHARTRWQRVRACGTHTFSMPLTHTHTCAGDTHHMIHTNKELTHHSYHIIYHHIWVCRLLTHAHSLMLLLKTVKSIQWMASTTLCLQKQPHD